MLKRLMCIVLFLAFAVRANAGEISFSVAASLKEAMNELTAEYTKKNPGVVFRKNYGASGALAKQIESGAPADLFISANLEWMDYLKERKLIDPATIGTFAGNTLVFAGTAGVKAAGMQDLPQAGHGSPSAARRASPPASTPWRR